MNYRTALVKRRLELIGMFPFVQLGKMCGKIFKLKTKHNIFLFYSWADIGGSIQVNIDIANCIKDAKPLIIFSKKPRNNLFRDRFDIEGVRVIDLHKYIDNKLFHFVNFFFRGVIASWVNAVDRPVVFGGECLFLYKMLPHVKDETFTAELNHYHAWFNYTQQHVRDIDYRIFSTPQIKRDCERHYKESGVPEQYLERLHFIDNAIDIPPLKQISNDVLQVIFVGRGSPQKRPDLAARIAMEMGKKGKKVQFSFIGDVESFIPNDAKPYCRLYGSVKDKTQMDELYTQSDVLLLTSLYEGLPLVVMDMMARGRVVVATAIDGIPDYIEHKKNGFLLTEKSEEGIIAQAFEYLDMLINDKELRLKLGAQSYKDAVAHFDRINFCNNYRQLLLHK